MALSLAANWMLVVLLSVGLQLCCCNVKRLLGGCRQTNDGATQRSALNSTGGCCQHRRKADAMSPDQCGNSTSKTSCDQRGGCACGTHDKGCADVAKSPLDVAPAVIAVLPPSTHLFLASIVRVGSYERLRNALPPPTSLLRQHCALIV